MEQSTLQIELAWDPGKAQANLTKHGVSFVLATEALHDPLALTVADQEHSRDEERWFTLGMTNNGQLLAVAHTWKEQAGIASVRIISARTATKNERRQYQDKPN